MPSLAFHSPASRALRTIFAHRGRTLVALDAQGLDDLKRVERTRALVPLLMQDVAALTIQACVRSVLHLEGAMAEAGVLMGGSARLICEAKGDARLHLFDVFEPAPSFGSAEAAVRGHFGAVHGKQEEVRRLLSSYSGVHLHPGVFPASAAQLADKRFAFVHLDMDLAESTSDALHFFMPRLVAGGILVGDDYQDPGVRHAFDAFFADRPGTRIHLPWGQVLVIGG